MNEFLRSFRPCSRVRRLLRQAAARVAAVARARLRGRPADAGMTTAEYAVGTVAACGFAALLYKVLTSGWVSTALADTVRKALHAV